MMSYENLTDDELRAIMHKKPFDKIAVYEAAGRFLVQPPPAEEQGNTPE